MHGRSPSPPPGMVQPPYHGHPPPMDMLQGGPHSPQGDMRPPYGDQPPQEFDNRPPPR